MTNPLFPRLRRAWLRERLGLRRSAVAAAIAFVSLCAVPAAKASLYDSIFVFGDSLSDSGNVFTVTDLLVPGSGIPPAPYFDGRFTNGPNYVDRLAQKLGLSAEALLRGGTNLAIGGATASPTGPFPISLVDQRDLYLALSGNQARAQGLYVTWIGSNDIQNVLDAAIIDFSSLGGAAAFLQQSVNDLRDTIVALGAAGAGTFLVPNVPLMGVVPKYTAFNSAELINLGNDLSIAFNAAVDQMLVELAQAPGAPRIVRLDTHALFSEALLSPATFGLTNVTAACISGDIFAPGTVCSNPDEYLFWDQTHPSARMHQAIGDLAFAAVVPLPGSVFLFGAGLLAFGFVARRRTRQA